MSLHPAPTRLLLPLTLLTLLLLPTLSVPPPDLRVSTPDRRLRGRPDSADPHSRPPRLPHQLPTALRHLIIPPKPDPPAPAARPVRPDVRPVVRPNIRPEVRPDKLPCTRRDVLAHLQCLCRLSVQSGSITPANNLRCRKSLGSVSADELSSDPCAPFHRSNAPTLRTFTNRAARLVVGCDAPTLGSKVVVRQRKTVPLDRLRSYIALVLALQDIVDDIFIPSNAPSRRSRTSSRIKVPAKDKTLRLMQYNQIQAP